MITARTKPLHDIYRGFDIDFSANHYGYDIWENDTLICSVRNYDAALNRIDNLLRTRKQETAK
jgi:hypothetical protein